MSLDAESKGRSGWMAGSVSRRVLLGAVLVTAMASSAVTSWVMRHAAGDPNYNHMIGRAVFLARQELVDIGYTCGPFDPDAPKRNTVAGRRFPFVLHCLRREGRFLLAGGTRQTTLIFDETFVVKDVDVYVSDGFPGPMRYF